MLRFRKETAWRGIAMSALVKAGLGPALAASTVGRRQPDTLPTANSGGVPFDVADRNALYRAMEKEL